MKYETIIFEQAKSGLVRLTLYRPEKHHALNATMISELHHAADAIAADKNARVVLIFAQGPSFCAGGDLKWMKAQFDADRTGKIAEARKLAMMLKAFHDLDKPVICHVQGQAFGGGLGLMAVSDIVVASETAQFALTETKLGLIPATIGPFVIAKIGGAAARSVFITGSMMTAQRARDLGLVSICVPAAELTDTVAREIKTALTAAPKAMARAKQMLREITSPALDDQIEHAINHLADCWEGNEAIEGITAFFNKGKPPWRAD